MHSILSIPDGPPQVTRSPEVPIVVDLDNTFIKSDMLQESFVALVFKHPLVAIGSLVYLIRGRAFFKEYIASLISISVEAIPVDPKVLDYLSIEKKRGRKVHLVSASSQKIVNKFKNYYSIFDSATGSTRNTNLKGRTKADYLVRRFGHSEYDYIGDSMADVPCWRNARRSLLVFKSNAQVAKIKKQIPDIAIIEGERGGVNTIVSTMRGHQWVKNILVFIPLVASHSVSTVHLLNTILAFISFSLMASSVYIVNDLIDLEHDRTHPIKKERSLASGKIPISNAVGIAIVLFISSFLISIMVSKNLMMSVLGYALLTSAYSIYLKREIIIDIVTLAGLYCLRIIAGSQATGIPVSPWLVIFALFLFFSLACTKRGSELHNLLRAQKTKAHGRGYRTEDLFSIQAMAICSGFISILIFALYANSNEVSKLYTHPAALFVICPIILFWLARVSIFSARGEVHEDPILFALRDKAGWACGAAAMTVFWLSI